MFQGYVVLIIAVMMLYPRTSPAADPTDPGVRMMETIRFLSSPEMLGRGVGTPELDRAAEYIARAFEAVGLLPGGDTTGSWYEEWTDPDTGMKMRNVIGLLPGRNPEFNGQSVVIGAHYDHLGMRSPKPGEPALMHPGADDNASGVAALIDAARSISLKLEPERTVVFAAFTGEETGRKGSRWYAANHKQYPASKCIAMVNLDTVGRLGKNKLIVIGGNSAKEWPGMFREIGNTLKMDIVVSNQDLDSSDQKSFHEAGVPAVQLFSGPHEDYHKPTDIARKIDAKGLKKIALAARAVVLYLANLPGPLTSTLSPQAAQAPLSHTERKVTMGIVPDFTHNEKGVRLGGAVDGGPAAVAGLREGDVIVRMDDKLVIGLKDMSDLLKTKQPGDRVTVYFKRQGKELKAEVVLKEK